MKNYLSIGEISKIKGVSVKSLRYYGEIGILPPVYVNKETGYRYYSVEQLVIVDLIIVCLDLDIPLKNFREYLAEDGSVDVGKLLADGKNIATEKVKKLKSTIAFLNTMSQHIVRTNKVKDRTDEFIQHIPKRYFLTAHWSGDITSYREISTKYSELYKKCTEFEVPDTFNQGVLFLKQEGRVIPKVFVEIPCSTTQMENLLVVAEGKFICKVIKDIDLPAILDSEVKDILIIKELCDFKLVPKGGLNEIQKYSYDYKKSY